MKIYSGTSGYGYKEWKGLFYPEKIQPKDMLSFYAGQLNTVEVNYTFHHMPTIAGVTTWGESVPDDFIFALKAPQIITHFKLLRNVNEEANYFFKTMSLLGDKTGPALFQFPGSFRANPALLEAFLDLIPKQISCAFEFRSKSWFAKEVLELLRARGCSLCMADWDEHPLHEIISTATWGYLRLRRADYNDDDLELWLDRILAEQWDKAFVFFKHEDGAKGPQLARRFQELAGARQFGEQQNREVNHDKAQG